jgi:hypothetical protein
MTGTRAYNVAKGAFQMCKISEHERTDLIEAMLTGIVNRTFVEQVVHLFELYVPEKDAQVVHAMASDCAERISLNAAIEEERERDRIEMDLWWPEETRKYSQEL